MNRRTLIAGGFAVGVWMSLPVRSQAKTKRPKPMVTKTELAPGLLLRYYHVVEYPEYGTWGVFCEYQNTAETVFDSVHAEMRFTDENNNVLMDEPLFAIAEIVRPGESAIVYTYVSDPEIVEGWANFEFNLNASAWGRTQKVQYADVSFEVVNEKIQERGDGYLTGYLDVKNVGSRAVAYAIVHIVSRNEKGRIVQIDRASVPSAIEPGQFVRTEISNSIYAPGVHVEYVVTAVYL